MPSGIYQIRNIITGEIYVGSAVNLNRRKGEHFYYLKRNRHHSILLQRNYNKYGLDCFKFEILAHCPREYLIKLEQWFLDNLKPSLNIDKRAGSRLGSKLSEETKALLSKLKKESPVSVPIEQRKINGKKSYTLHNHKGIIAFNDEVTYSFISISEAARQLKICRPNIHRAIRFGKLINNLKFKYELYNKP